MAARVLPLALLLAGGVVFAARALGTGLVLFDDHPGQLYRLWHVLTRGPAPWAWQPGWWAGYPELQFYPPGAAYAGALLQRASLGALSPEGAYQALVWLAYLLPGLTAYLALARVLGSGWLALPGALVALTFSGGASGVEGGVHVGMVGARLAWGLLPLLLWLQVPWTHGLDAFTPSPRAGRAPWLAAPLVAAITLMHPAALPAAVVVVLLAALARPPRATRLGAAALQLALAAALTAFWWLPLLARIAHTRPLAWGERPGVDALTLALALLAVLALVRAVYASRAAVVLALWPWAMAAVTLADGAVLEPLGLRWLPADRVADGAVIALILAAGLGWSGFRTGARREALVGLAGVVLVVLAGLAGGALAVWPRPAVWPRAQQLETGLRLESLWNALRRAPEGRVLFVRSGVPLVYRGDWWRPHTHVTALAPARAGREIVNGTFTHPSPIAALVYRGDAGPGAILTLVERLDGASLFGRPLAALDAPTFGRYAERLGVSTVVALDLDLPRLAWLDASPDFERAWQIGFFVAWTRRAGLAIPKEVAPGRWRVALEGAPGAWAPARIAYYPLWRATRGGVPLETRRGDFGDLEVRLPPAGGGMVELVYAPGAPELAGVALSAAALVAWALAGAKVLLRGSSRHGAMDQNQPLMDD
ncbi:MAG TPA: hypothetical protein DDZ42_20915 [Candidatus Rokubacteria bacterium]|nr:MAG: hypothetical protein A2050_09450 [Candidatus Rokubacteria bacterium GWA2_73_35]HBH04340.1 hypothetical protein [Candidatus Rokubacteria bacterium]